MKITLRMLALTLIFFIAIAVNGQNNFRNTKWGFSKNDVIGTENAKPVADESRYLIYSTELDEMSGKIKYNFNEEGKLMSASYIFKIEDENYKKCIKDYDFFKKLLKEKYSSPETDGLLWINEPADKSENKWASHLATGNIVFSAIWKTSKTFIELSLYNVNKQIYLTIDYTSTIYKENFSPGDIKKIKEEL